MNYRTGSRSALRMLRELDAELPPELTPARVLVTVVHVDGKRPPAGPAVPVNEAHLIRPSRDHVDPRPLVLPLPTYTGPARPLTARRLAQESPIFAAMLAERRGRWPGVPSAPLALTAGGAR